MPSYISSNTGSLVKSIFGKWSESKKLSSDDRQVVLVDIDETICFYSGKRQYNLAEPNQENINADYFGYDQKHFKGHTCVQILSNFSLHYLKNEYSNFKYYGNNDIMWHPPRFLDGAGFSRAATDCFRIQDKEIIAKEMNQVVH